MSLISLASVRALQEDAVAEGKARPGRIPGAADAQERIVGQLVAFIPAEPVTLFIARPRRGRRARAAFWVRWIAVRRGRRRSRPLWVEIHYLQKARSRKARQKLPLFEMSAGVIAFVAWSTSVPVSPWEQIGGFTDAVGPVDRARDRGRAAHGQRAARGTAEGEAARAAERGLSWGRARRRVRAVLERLEREDADERERGSIARSCARGQSRRRRGASSSLSSRRRTRARCSRSAARAATRRSGSPPARGSSAGGCSRSSTTPRSARPGGANVADAGLEEWAELVEGDAFERRCRRSRTSSTSSSSTPRRRTTSGCSGSPGGKVEPGGLVVADNVLSHEETLGAYSRARQADPTLVSVTVPLDRGLEISAVLTETLE